MSAAPSDAPATVELGGGFIYVRRPDGHAAILAPHVQTAGVAGMMSPTTVNARDAGELRAWLEHWGFERATELANTNQVHGSIVVEARADDGVPIDADGLWSASSGLILTVKAADCAPIWFADMASKRFALVHAGWRGVAAGIVAAAVDALAGAGSKIEDLAVAVGPHLGPCCFEVGPEVADSFKTIDGAMLAAERLTTPRRRDDSMVLDLAAAIRADLSDVGVRDHQVFVATACTRCHPALFHSYRRNGSGGPLMVAIAARRG
ncbi:MAG: peptidoglycan editing factor PgeF [Candidatus Eremiobacteraeota bacterium]|nr:peptidoglycan editing factor PgeF [Candidatus Eremiobacteraeota bacterium]